MTPDRKDRNADRERQYRHLVDQASEPLFVVDAEDRLEIVNGEFLALVGYERDEIVGMEATDLFSERGVNRWNQRVNLLRTDKTAESETWSGRVVTNNGTEVPVQFEVSPLRTDAGTYDGLVGTASDAREQQRREERLNILNRTLRHNIRNRMNLILGQAETLQEIDDEGYRTAAERIEDVADEIITMSNKARKAHKYLDIPADEECRIDLVPMIEKVVVKFGISYPSATVTTDTPESARARAPPSTEIALTELVENAVIHHPSGDGPVTVEVESADDRILVRVTDECDPIPETVTDTIDDGEESPLHHNEGIGLWIVKWVVETVGGDLSFDRRPDDSGNVVTLAFDAIE